jgi:hypothetical protein
MPLIITLARKNVLISLREMSTVRNFHAGVIFRPSMRLQPGVEVARTVEVEQGFVGSLKAVGR